MVQIQHWKNPTTPNMLVVWANEDRPKVSKPLWQAQCFVWVLHYQPLSLIRYTGKLDCWQTLQWHGTAECCSAHNLTKSVSITLSPILWQEIQGTICRLVGKETREKADVWAKWINKTLARGNPQLDHTFTWMYMSPLMYVLKKLVSSN